MFARVFFPEGHGRRYEAMEGLRGFSAWLVFSMHLCGMFAGQFFATDVVGTPLWKLPGLRLKLLAWGASSNYGVDLFFLLSGFLLFRMMIARQGRFHYGRYLWQRIIRIYPALLLAYPVALVLLHLPNHYARAMMFLAGGLLAVNSDEQLTAWARRMPEPLVIGLYLAATTAFALRSGFHWERSTLIFAPAAMALMVKTCYGSGVLNRVCRWTWLRAFGNISYSFYLIHAMCLILVGRALMQLPGLPAAKEIRFLLWAVAGMALALLLSTALYLVAERGYFLRGSHPQSFSSRWQSLVVMPACCAVTLAFCTPYVVDSLRIRSAIAWRSPCHWAPGPCLENPAARPHRTLLLSAFTCPAMPCKRIRNP